MTSSGSVAFWTLADFILWGIPHEMGREMEAVYLFSYFLPEKPL
jgi:hypothetical protein